MKYKTFTIILAIITSAININFAYAENDMGVNDYDDVLSGSALEVINAESFNAALVNSSTSEFEILADGKYYIDETTNISNIVIADSVNAEITISNLNWDLTGANGFYGKSAISIGENSDVKLIIEGNNKLISDERAAGIYVGLDSTLTIDGNGTLEVNSEYGCAIGGSDHDHDYSSSGLTGLYGNIVINDGTITAKSQYAAGIGGMPWWSQRNEERPSGIVNETYCDTGNIIVNGGNVTAIGGKSSAGIGGDYEHGIGDYIAIYGGVVNAYGGYHASGIGYGEKGYAKNRNIEGDIRIYGGIVNAYGGEGASGIGKGYDSNVAPTIKIYGGTISALGGKDASGIDVSYPSYDISAGWIEVCAGTVTAIGNGNGYGIDTHQIWINGGSVKGIGTKNINSTMGIKNYNTNKGVKVNRIYAPNISGKTVKINNVVTTIPNNHPDDDYIYVYTSEGNSVTIEGGDEKKGDISGDGKITAVDAMLIAQLASGKRLDEFMYNKADINGDGKVTAVDAMLLARYASGKIKNF